MALHQTVGSSGENRPREESHGLWVPFGVLSHVERGRLSSREHDSLMAWSRSICCREKGGEEGESAGASDSVCRLTDAVAPSLSYLWSGPLCFLLSPHVSGLTEHRDLEGQHLTFPFSPALKHEGFQSNKLI